MQLKLLACANGKGNGKSAIFPWKIDAFGHVQDTPMVLFPGQYPDVFQANCKENVENIIYLNLPRHIHFSRSHPQPVFQVIFANLSHLHCC